MSKYIKPKSYYEQKRQEVHFRNCKKCGHVYSANGLQLGRRLCDKCADRKPLAAKPKKSRLTHVVATEKCFYCGDSISEDSHIDHIIPLSRGGKDHAFNTMRICKKCNMEKKDKTPWEYIEWIRQKAYEQGSLDASLTEVMQ